MRADADFVLDAPPARTNKWSVAAAIFGVPWLALTLVSSVWYLGWGVPDGWILRLLIWVVSAALTGALHALALLSVWGVAYTRDGSETVLVDAERITLERRAWRIPISLHIRRTLIERAELLPPRAGRGVHPRIEIRAGRSAFRFGAGLDPAEASASVDALNAFFTRSAAERSAR